MLRKWWFWALSLVVLLIAGLAVAASIMARRLEPFVREETARYLRERFDADVEIGSLDASLAFKSVTNVLLAGGRGALVRAKGENITLRHKGRRDVPPLIQMTKFEFELDVSTLWNHPIDIRKVKLEAFTLTIPPKGERPSIPKGEEDKTPEDNAAVRIREIVADDALLTILPKISDKAPLVFKLHELHLFDAGPGRAMRYEAELTNAKPPGTIISKGTFGPWVTSEPSNTPLTGDYTFDKADLGVFKGIAGTLSSKGHFEGILNRIVVDGTTNTPDFRLTMSGNRVPLSTTFHAIVDGTNGNTLLEPVEAQLGRTSFECRGGVVRNKDEVGKTVALDVKLRQGTIEDLLRLAMKGNKPILRGGVNLKMQFELPPGRGEISDRLKLSGTFSLLDARFTTATVQEQIDNLSRRGQGRPKDQAIDEVPSDLDGSFVMQRGRIEFSRLRFTVPGSEVRLAGAYRFETDEVDFHGELRLEARVSETMTGWKRLVLKPVDPFFAKKGAGTLLKIAVTGQSSTPKFGLDLKRKD